MDTVTGNACLLLHAYPRAVFVDHFLLTGLEPVPVTPGDVDFFKKRS